MAALGRSDSQDRSTAPGDPVERSRPSRRSLIRGAVAAGIGAWTAPIILDSLASPAAAASFRCFQVNKPVNQTSSPFTAVGWDDTAWTNGPGPAPNPNNGTPCEAGGCSPAGTASATLLGSIPDPSGNVTWGGTQAVTVSAPSGYKIVGVGVTLQSSSNFFDPNLPAPLCSTSTTAPTPASARFNINQIGTTSVTITPKGGPNGGASTGFWDTIITGNDGRTYIVLRLQST